MKTMRMTTQNTQGTMMTGRRQESTAEAKKRRPDQRQKTLRAFGVYLDLLDTTEYFRRWMRGPLESFDLTMQGFRLMVILYRDGATPMQVAAKELRCTRQNLNVVVARLERRGWARRGMLAFPAVEDRLSRLAKFKRGRPRQGRRFGVLRLTNAGEKIIAVVLPRHAKVVKALMRVLDGREQDHLMRLCRKLRVGDVLKFVSEIRLADKWDEVTRKSREVREAEAREAQGAKEVREIEEAANAKKAEEAKEAKEVKEVKETEAGVAAIAAGAAAAVPERKLASRPPKTFAEPRETDMQRGDDWQQAMSHDWTPRGSQGTDPPVWRGAPRSNRNQVDANRPGESSTRRVPGMPLYLETPEEIGQALLKQRVNPNNPAGPNEAVWEILNPVKKPQPRKFSRVRRGRARW